ncbi:hypothetical protein vseg_013848 [Gypsophila vaccaria]
MKNLTYSSSSCLALILVLVLVIKTANSQKITVHVVNALPDNEPLTVHCKSKDDDLGQHTIGVTQEVNWTFHENFFLTTLYYCDMWWSKARGHFDVFTSDGKILEDACKLKDCRWEVRAEALFLYNRKTKMFEEHYKW